jgi:hypothetical protein
MSRHYTHLITTCLIGTGAAAWAFAGRPLVTNKDLAVPLNPFGLNRSPYGEVIAMAMQGPVENYFNVAMGFQGRYQAEKEDKPVVTAKKLSPIAQLDHMVSDLDKVIALRTNPQPPSQAQKLYLRRQSEDKLRFAYNLDPSHFANYTALHFFLTEGITTRKESAAEITKLADDTIDYCFTRNDDPKAALTAAAAATNILHMLFLDQRNAAPQFTLGDMRKSLAKLDVCIANYQTISTRWDRTDNWKTLSPDRVTECIDRIDFIRKIRDAGEQGIINLEKKSTAPDSLKTSI